MIDGLEGQWTWICIARPHKLIFDTLERGGVRHQIPILFVDGKYAAYVLPFNTFHIIHALQSVRGLTSIGVQPYPSPESGPKSLTVNILRSLSRKSYTQQSSVTVNHQHALLDHVPMQEDLAPHP